MNNYEFALRRSGLAIQVGTLLTTVVSLEATPESLHPSVLDEVEVLPSPPLDDLAFFEPLLDVFRLKCQPSVCQDVRMPATEMARFSLLSPKSRLAQDHETIKTSQDDSDFESTNLPTADSPTVKNIGASPVKQVANATNDIAGDGTAYATVLTRDIFSEAASQF
ncbi:chaperonin CPN60-like protein 1, mitochondrial [Tanacetum coccineum]